MNTFISLFTRNWGLKLLALVLALVVYYSMRDSIRSSQSRPTAPAFLKGPSHAG
jgi:hypothetical protein